MAYTLKDYHDDVEASIAPFRYDVSEEADAPNETLFRAVYEKCRAKWIADEKRATENHIAELLPVPPEDAESLIAQERAHALDLRKEGLAGYFIAPEAPLRFDEAAAKRYFAAHYRSRLAAVRKEFPAPVLSAVADVRLLALGVVSPRVKLLFMLHRAECRERWGREGKASHERYRKLIEKYPQFKDFTFHDREIVSFRREGKDMVMKLATYNKLTFKNATFLRRDGSLGRWNLRFEEARVLDNGFEIEILAQNTQSTRLVILRCDDVEITHVPEGTPSYVIPGHEDWFSRARAEDSHDASANPAYTLMDYDRDVQESNLAHGLVEIPEAEKLNEALFHRTYEQLLNDELARERTYIEKHNRELQKGTLAPHLMAAFGTTPMVFDPEKVERKFEERFNGYMQANAKRYPPAIYAEVADPRMLALHVVSPRVLNMVKTHANECRKRYKREQAALKLRYYKLVSEYPRLNQFSYHDDGIVSFNREGRDMVMKLDTPARLTFKNVTILRQDGSLDGYWWCYEEVRPIEQGFEVEIYARGCPDRLLILRCDDIEIVNLPDGTPGYAIPGQAE